MTLRRLAALTAYWDQSPPTHVLVREIAGALGAKRQHREAPVQARLEAAPPQAESGAEQVEQLMAMFPQSPFPLPKPMLPEEYLRRRAEALNGDKPQ